MSVHKAVSHLHCPEQPCAAAPHVLHALLSAHANICNGCCTPVLRFIEPSKQTHVMPKSSPCACCNRLTAVSSKSGSIWPIYAALCAASFSALSAMLLPRPQVPPLLQQSTFRQQVTAWALCYVLQIFVVQPPALVCFAHASLLVRFPFRFWAYICNTNLDPVNTLHLFSMLEGTTTTRAVQVVKPINADFRICTVSHLSRPCCWLQCPCMKLLLGTMLSLLTAFCPALMLYETKHTLFSGLTDCRCSNTDPAG